MILTQNLSKTFGRSQILKNISLEIQKGEIVGILGQNGAGKTTLMRILTSYLVPTAGRAVVAGFDVVKERLSVCRQVGYLPETPPLYPNMNVADYLKFAASLKDVPAKRVGQEVDRVLEECRLKDVRHKTIQILSKGYKQRLGIAQAIIHDPAVLILDEPTNGLDPRQILQVRDLIKSLEQKRTVIVSTHILSEIEQIARRVIVIHNGGIAADKPLKEMTAGTTIEAAFLKLTEGSHE